MTERSVGVLTVVAAVLVIACLGGVALGSPPLRAVSGGGVALLTLLTLRSVWRHVRLARALAATSQPGVIESVPVRLRPLPSHASVAGLLRPSIYCDPSLTDRLTAGQLRAVVLHERSHQRHRDPLRLAILAAIDPFARVLPGGRPWLERQRAVLEIRADQEALRNGASRPALAAAVLRLGGRDPQHAAAGFASATELRLRALVDPDATRTSGRGWPAPLLALGAVVTACGAAVAHHWLMGAGGLGCVLAGC